MKKLKKVSIIVSRLGAAFTGAVLVYLVMLVFSKPQSGFAAPGDLSSAVSKYPNIAGSSLQSCDLCHTSSIPSLNPYGAAYKANGRNSAAFGMIENQDSDGDGFSNIQEIHSLTFPGNPASFPSVPTSTNTPTFTNTPVATKTSSSTSTPTPSRTATPTPTASTIPPTAASLVPTPTITPTNSPTNTPTNAQISTFVTIGLTPASVVVDGITSVAVTLNNIPTGGFASAEFTCSYNPNLVEISDIADSGRFGADAVIVVNGPENGNFIVAIAGSNGRKATTSGPAFTFSAKAEEPGQLAIDCQTRVSTGNQSLTAISSTPANLLITTSQGSFTGKVLASKPVTITLYNPDGSVAGSVIANIDGSFSLSVNAGTYTAVASAAGYLKAQGTFVVTNGSNKIAQTINLPAGDIDGNNVIDQIDALTIGINYNSTSPAEADLNKDGIINVLDMEILARNYRKAGALSWQ